MCRNNNNIIIIIDIINTIILLLKSHVESMFEKLMFPTKHFDKLPSDCFKRNLNASQPSLNILGRFGYV